MYLVLCRPTGEVFNSWISYESCQRTQAEDEFAIVRLQVFCLFVGAIAFASVRRQKVLHASLFDRRRLRAKEENAGGTTRTNSTMEVEMTAAREERVPLTENDTLAVV